MIQENTTKIRLSHTLPLLIKAKRFSSFQHFSNYIQYIKHNSYSHLKLQDRILKKVLKSVDNISLEDIYRSAKSERKIWGDANY